MSALKKKHEDDEELVVVESEKKDGSIGLTLLSVALDFVPIVGDLKGIGEAIVGHDLVTKEKLSVAERIIGVIPFGKVAKELYKGARVVEKRLLHEVVDNLKLPKSAAATKSVDELAKMESALATKKQGLKDAIDKGQVTFEGIKEGSDNVRKNATKFRNEQKASIDAVPDAKQREKLHAELKKQDVDHVLDLQWGGKDVDANLQLLDKRVNRSVGTQLEKATSDGLLDKLADAQAQQAKTAKKLDTAVDVATTTAQDLPSVIDAVKKNVAAKAEDDGRRKELQQQQHIEERKYEERKYVSVVYVCVCLMHADIYVTICLRCVA